MKKTTDYKHVSSLVAYIYSNYQCIKGHNGHCLNKRSILEVDVDCISRYFGTVLGTIAYNLNAVQPGRTVQAFWYFRYDTRVENWSEAAMVYCRTSSCNSRGCHREYFCGIYWLWFLNFIYHEDTTAGSSFHNSFVFWELTLPRAYKRIYELHTPRFQKENTSSTLLFLRLDWYGDSHWLYIWTYCTVRWSATDFHETR